jgi:molybdopterin-containing oxidoreductase family iron-sulfur binding subunit
LKAAGSEGVLVSGIQDKTHSCWLLQLIKLWLVRRIPAGARQIRKGSNEKVAQLVADMKAGSVHTLLMSGVNPVYTLADSASFVAGLKSYYFSCYVS